MAGLNAGLRVPKTIKLFIDGKFPRTESGRTYPVFVNKSEELFAHLCQSSRKDLRNSVTAAGKAQKGWADRTAYNRGQILYRMAEMAEGKRAEFVDIFKTTRGMTEKQANTSVDEAVNAFVYYAGWADKYAQVMGGVNPVAGPFHNFTTPDSMGVVGLITNTKFNFGQFAAQLAGIIVSGNTTVAVIEDGAEVIATLAEVFATSDLPGGVINLLSGFEKELYTHMGSHMEVHSVNYQGDNKEVIGELAELGIDNMKRFIKPTTDAKSLNYLLNFVEYKTIWHPIGY